MFERAIELDPGVVPAHALPASTYATQYRYSLQRDTGLIDRTEAYAHRCLALDPQNAPGHFSPVLNLL